MTLAAFLAACIGIVFCLLWEHERTWRRLERERHAAELRALELEIERLRIAAQRPPVRLPVLWTRNGPLTTLYRN